MLDGPHMDKKKKPPPGATLIQRMREARIRREQSDASEHNVEPASQSDLATGRKAETTALVEQKTTRSLPDKTKSPKDTNTTAKKVAPATEQHSFVRASISIDDLRPVNDDYQLLTEEIKLAGRFAAAGLIAQGFRLCRLRDAALYKEHYGSFEEYCRAEHAMSATYAYRLIRMSEMAEKLAADRQRANAAEKDLAMPDPFEIMLGLGHRHLMALLPLGADAAEELLVQGIPPSDANSDSAARIPIARATEQQIRQAISALVNAQVAQAVSKAIDQAPRTASLPKSARSLSELLALMQEWADWLESEPKTHMIESRVGQGREISRMSQQLQKTCERMVAALAMLPRSRK